MGGIKIPVTRDLFCLFSRDRKNKKLLTIKNDLMPDNLKNKGKQDDIRINIHQAHELRYWSERLDISQRKLKEIVKRTGPMVNDVLEHLGCKER